MSDPTPNPPNSGQPKTHAPDVTIPVAAGVGGAVVLLGLLLLFLRRRHQLANRSSNKYKKSSSQLNVKAVKSSVDVEDPVTTGSAGIGAMPDRSISMSTGTKNSSKGTPLSTLPQFLTPSTGKHSGISSNTFKTVSDYATTIATIMSQRTMIAEKEFSVPGFLQLDNPNSDLIMKRELAHGGFSSVWLADINNSEMVQRVKTNVCVAKILNKSDDSDMEGLFLQEVAILNFFRNQEHIVQTHTIVLKYYNGGALSSVLQAGTIAGHAWEPELLFSLVMDITSGIRSLHAVGIIHNDIKPHNILLEIDAPTRRVSAHLSDFGVAQIITDKANLVKAFKKMDVEAASYQFSAPELIFNQKITDGPDEIRQSVDIYSFSMVLLNLLTRRLPWFDCQTKEQIEARLKKRLHPQIPSQLLMTEDPILKKLVEVTKNCWSFNAEERLNITNILKFLHRPSPKTHGSGSLST